MAESIASKIDKIIFTMIKGTIFLLPLFFLPWTSEYFDFNKQFLLWLSLPAAVLLWFLKATWQGQIKIKINPLNLLILIFLSLTLAAAWFSLDRFSSFFGYFGRFSDAYFGLLSLALLYFLIINAGIADSRKKIFGLLKILLYSSTLVAAAALFAILGGLKAVFGQAPGFFSAAPFNLVGNSLLVLVVYLAVISVMQGIFLVGGNLKKIDKVIFSAGLIINLIILTFINFSLSWALLFLGAGLIIFFRWLANGFNFKKRLSYHLFIPAILMIPAALMLVLPNLSLAKTILGQDLPKETLLGHDQAFAITRETLKKNPALGSGPGTFAYDFSLYRPTEMNNSHLWQIRFDKSSSHFLETLATAGLLTALSYFLVVSLVVYLNIVLIKKHLKSGDSALADLDDDLLAALSTVFTLLFIFQLFFLTNTVLNFIFWLCLGLIIAFWQGHDQVLFKARVIQLNRTVWHKRLFLMVCFILSSGWIVLLFFEIKFFTADMIAAKKFSRETNLITAIKLNPYRYNYRISLAKLYLSQARAEVLKPIEERNNVNLQYNIARAVETAKQAQALAPNSVLAQETMGMIYRDLRPLTLGSEAWAIKSFKQAFSLEPTNPILAAELAKAYLNDNDLFNAEKYFKKALGLKSDYYEAKFGLAKTYLSGKKDNQALVILNGLERQLADPEIYYELGRLYYNHGEIDRAIDKFKQALSLAPRHSNSLYGLGIAFEAKGDTEEALKYYSQTLELNPDNSEIKKKVETLSK